MRQSEKSLAGKGLPVYDHGGLRSKTAPSDPEKDGARVRRRKSRKGGIRLIVKVISSTVIGIDSHPVTVEVDLSAGLPLFSTVGLPDVAVRESKDRIKAAVKNSGYPFP